MRARRSRTRVQRIWGLLAAAACAITTPPPSFRLRPQPCVGPSRWRPRASPKSRGGRLRPGHPSDEVARQSQLTPRPGGRAGTWPPWCCPSLPAPERQAPETTPAGGGRAGPGPGGWYLLKATGWTARPPPSPKARKRPVRELTPAQAVRGSRGVARRRPRQGGGDAALAAPPCRRAGRPRYSAAQRLMEVPRAERFDLLVIVALLIVGVGGAQQRGRLQCRLRGRNRHAVSLLWVSGGLAVPVLVVGRAAAWFAQSATKGSRRKLEAEPRVHLRAAREAEALAARRAPRRGRARRGAAGGRGGRRRTGAATWSRLMAATVAPAEDATVVSDAGALPRATRR